MRCPKHGRPPPNLVGCGAEPKPRRYFHPVSTLGLWSCRAGSDRPSIVPADTWASRSQRARLRFGPAHCKRIVANFDVGSGRSPIMHLLDLVSGLYNFLLFLDLVELRALILICHDPVVRALLSRCAALIQNLNATRLNLFQLRPDQIHVALRDQIRPLIDRWTRPLHRLQLSMMARRNARCLITKLCQLEDDNDTVNDLDLVAERHRARLQIVFGAAVSFRRPILLRFALERLRGVVDHPSLIDIALDDADRIAATLTSLHTDTTWTADRIVALIDVGYDPVRFTDIVLAMVEGRRHAGIAALLDCVQTPDLLVHVDDNGMNVVSWAAERNDHVLLRICADFLARFDQRRFECVMLADEIRQMSPLILAAYRGHAESVRVLLDLMPVATRQRALKQVDFRGRTAIHWAAYNGHERVLRTLFDGCGIRAAQLSMMAMVDTALGGHRPDHYPHLPASILDVFQEIRHQRRSSDADQLGHRFERESGDLSICSNGSWSPGRAAS